MQEATIKIKFIDGLIDREKTQLLSKLIETAQPEHEVMITLVSPDDLDSVQEMVSSAAIFADDAYLCHYEQSERTTAMIKKLCVAIRYMLSGFRTVVDFGNGREERDCTLSVKTSACHIHLPLDVNDKKLEKCVKAGLDEAYRLYKEGKSDLLCHYDEKSDRMLTETKDDYVRRVYFDSGLIKPEDIK